MVAFRSCSDAKSPYVVTNWSVTLSVDDVVKQHKSIIVTNSYMFSISNEEKLISRFTIVFHLIFFKNMKFILISICCSAFALSFSGCRTATKPKNVEGTTSATSRISNPASTTVRVETVEFRTGVSSTTVEKLAQNYGCVGGKGAGLITEQGPVEIYRMQCNDGKVFLAQCELRQCSAKR